MKMSHDRTSVLLTLMCLISATAACAAPAPWGIAINQDTKECAGYWAGDEYMAYRLPKEWSAYYPDPSTGMINTASGNCRFIELKEGEEEKCCTAIGYRYTVESIGKFEPFKGFLGLFIMMGIAFSAVAAIVILVLILRWIRKKTTKKPTKRSRK